MSQQNFVKISSCFLLCHFAHFAKIAITRVCVLQSCTHIGGLKENTSIDFWANLINIEGVTSDFTHKSKFNFCQAGAVLEISLRNSLFVRTCTVGSSRRISIDAATQIFAKVSNFPSWWPKQKRKRSSLHFLNFELKQKPVTPLFNPLCMSRETL